MRPYHHNLFDTKANRESFATKVLYYTTLITGIVGPFTIAPQIIKIFNEKNAQGVSLLSWVLFTISCVPFILWGIARRDTPVIATYILWAIADFLVVVGILMNT